MNTTKMQANSHLQKTEASWHVIDAEGKTLGRLSTEISELLQGKHKPTYVPYVNTGDFVVVINAEKIRVTGNKMENKIYYRHSGYHGGLTERKLSDILRTHPTRALKQSVKGMLPKNTVGRRMLSRLKLYSGNTHPHSAQTTIGHANKQLDKQEQNDKLHVVSKQDTDELTNKSQVAKQSGRSTSKKGNVARKSVVENVTDSVQKTASEEN